jgi:hypothetical protein
MAFVVTGCLSLQLRSHARTLVPVANMPKVFWIFLNKNIRKNYIVIPRQLQHKFNYFGNYVEHQIIIRQFKNVEIDVVV